MVPANFDASLMFPELKKQGFVCGTARNGLYLKRIYHYAEPGTLENMHRFKDITEITFFDLIKSQFYFDESLFYEALKVVK